MTVRQEASKASCRNSLETLGFRIQGRFGLCRSVTFFSRTEGIFFPCLCSTAEFKGRIMQTPSAHRFLAVYLTLFGYLGDVYTGTVLMNSNAIKNLPAASGSKGSDTVSPSPHTSPSGSVGHKLPVDTLQVIPVRKSHFCAPRQKLRLCKFYK